MAYKAEIQVGVLGLQQLKELEERLVKINSLVTRLNKTKNTPIVDTAAINKSVSTVNTLNKSLERTLQLQEKVNKGALPSAIPAAPGGTAGGGGGKSPQAGKQGKGIGSAISSAAIGGAFPLLFGQGAGAAAGGAIGGVAGELALGPAGGFAGSLIGTAVGAAADADAAVAKLAATLGLAGTAAEQFGQAFRGAGVDLQTFTQAVNTIQDIALPFEQQKTAIEIASKVSANYKGSITAVAGALQELGTTGEVSVSTLTQLTKANVPIVDSLAKSYGLTKDQVIDLAAKGGISVEQLTKELAKLANETRPQTTIEKLGAAFQNLTTNVLKVFGPALDAVGTAFTTTANLIADSFGFIADVIFPQIKEAVAPLGQALAEAFPADVLQSINTFFANILLKALQSVAQGIAALTPILVGVVNKFKELSSNPVFKFIAEQVARLANFLGLTGNQVQQYSNNQKQAGQATKVTADQAARLAAELVRVSDAQNAAVQAQLNNLANLKTSYEQVLRLQQSIATTSKELNTIDQQKLSRELEYATSLNQTSAIIDKIAQKKQEANAQDVEAAVAAADASVRQAQIDAQSAAVRAQAAAFDLANKKDLGAVERTNLEQIVQQGQIAQQNVGITAQIAENTKKAAVERGKDNAIAIELGRRQQQVAAFAAEAARQSEAFSRASQVASNALNNQVQVTGAVVQAVQTINNLELQSLQTKLSQAQTEGERFDIINKIRDLEIENAQLTLIAARQQIAAEVERQRTALANAEVKFRELQAVVELARAQGVLNQAYIDALNAQRSALAIAQNNFQTSIQVANAQNAAADATFRAAVNAANFKAQLEGSARAAGAIAGSLNQAASAASRGAGGITALSQGANVFFGEAGKNPVFIAAYQEAIKRLRDSGISTQKDFDRVTQSFIDLAADFNAAVAGERLAGAAEDFIQKSGNVSAGLALFDTAINSGTNAAIKLDIASSEAAQALRERYRLRGAMDASAGGGAGFVSNQQNTGGGSSFTPQVNITTGPVMQMGNDTFVTQGDLVRASQQAAQQGANLALQNLQNSPSLRRNAGLAR